MGKYLKTKFEHEEDTTKYDNFLCALVGIFGFPASLFVLMHGKRLKIDVRDTKELTFAKDCIKGDMTIKETKAALKDWRIDHPDDV